jgi:hypothetical protein
MPGLDPPARPKSASAWRRPGHPSLFDRSLLLSGWPGHRRAEATPFFERLRPAMTSAATYRFDHLSANDESG